MGCFRTPIASIRSSILPLFVDFDFGLGFLAEFTLIWFFGGRQQHYKGTSSRRRNRSGTESWGFEKQSFAAFGPNVDLLAIFVGNRMTFADKNGADEAKELRRSN